MTALEFCIVAHEGQKRKYSGVPFHEHPIAVATMLKEIIPGCPQDVIDAAYLHDVLEDTKYTVHDLREAGFNEHVILFVVECTNVYSKCGLGRSMRKYMESKRVMTITTDAKTIKIADSIHNMRDFIQQDPKFARDVYLPEKRKLLDNALRCGDSTLWKIADKVIKDFMVK